MTIPQPLHADGVLILSGYNVRAVVSLCRYLADQRIPVHLVARGPDDPIYRTTYRDRVAIVRDDASLSAGAICEWIETIRATHGHRRLLVAPSTEFLNRILVRDRSAIERAGGIVPLVARRLYETISDKFAFSKICARHGIDVPRELDPFGSRYPFVAKPRTYSSSRSGRVKPYIVQSDEDWSAFLAREHREDYFFQEYVRGRSIYLLAHFSRSGQTTTFSQENLLQQAHGGSILLARPHDFHLDPVAQAYLRLFHRLHFHGLVMVEIRWDEDDGRHVMIEANPRLWGPIQFPLDRGVDLFGPLLRDYGLPCRLASEPSRARRFYFWSGGFGAASRPFAFHGYHAAAFVDELGEIVRSDLFDRPDTVDLFTMELAG